MALRFYFSQVTGTGTDANPYKPAIPDGITWGADDLRANGTLSSGWMIVWADTDATQHAALVADARIAYLPIEDTAGNPLSPDDPISAIDATKRAQIVTRLEARHVSFAGLSLSDPIRRAIARIIRRIRQMRAMGADNWTESLDVTVGSIQSARRTRVRNALIARGFDMTPVLNADTLREALRKLAIQDVPWQRNGWD